MQLCAVIRFASFALRASFALLSFALRASLCFAVICAARVIALRCHMRFARHFALLSFALRASYSLRASFASLSYALRASFCFAVISLRCHFALRAVIGHWWRKFVNFLCEGCHYALRASLVVVLRVCWDCPPVETHGRASLHVARPTSTVLSIRQPSFLPRALWRIRCCFYPENAFTIL